MKVLLINPPVRDMAVWVREGRCQQWDIWGAPFAPFSLAMISTSLVREGQSTRIIDAGPEKKTIDDVLAEAQAFSPDLIILSTASPTIESDLGWFAPELKKVLPESPIAAVGIHVTALPGRTLTRYPDVEYIIMGEPEQACANLVDALASGRTPLGLANIAGREPDGGIVIGEQQEFCEDIDALGFPDWEKIDFSHYPLPIINQPFSLISFSRGCPYGCKFCAAHTYNGKKLRKRSIPSLIEEIEFNLRLNVRNFLFWTELMTLDDDYLNDFLDELIRSGLSRKIRWVCNSRVDSVHLPTLKKMREAGCWQIAFGLEFGSDKILQLAGKGGNATTEQGRKAVEAADAAGIVVDGHFIMGYPGESEGDLQATTDFACSLPLTFAHFYAAVPFPGSELYTTAVNNGWCSPEAWESYTQDSSTMLTTSLTPEVVNGYISKAYRSFYLRPIIMKRVLKIPANFNEYVNVAKMGWQFMCHFVKNK